MQALEDSLHFLDGLLGSAAYFPFVLLAVGIFFTFYLGFPQIRFFKRAWGVLSGRYAKPGAAGDTSHFQALSTALSGTVGTGNIGGVALAIFLGGPAAVFLDVGHRVRGHDDQVRRGHAVPQVPGQGRFGKDRRRSHVLHGARPQHEMAGGLFRRSDHRQFLRFRQYAAEQQRRLRDVCVVRPTDMGDRPACWPHCSASSSSGASPASPR